MKDTTFILIPGHDIVELVGWHMFQVGVVPFKAATVNIFRYSMSHIMCNVLLVVNYHPTFQSFGAGFS